MAPSLTDWREPGGWARKLRKQITQSNPVITFISGNVGILVAIGSKVCLMDKIDLTVEPAEPVSKPVSRPVSKRLKSKIRKLGYVPVDSDVVDISLH